MGSIFIGTLNILASFLWSSGTMLARRFSKNRIRLPARVISVGNIQVGGAGKTPLVAYLARQAKDRGLTVCILCRGYGARWETQGGVIAPGLSSPDARECGDEASLLHELAPDAWIGVGADRARQFDEVLKLVSRIDLVLLDDGFQNHRLEKDLDIVALTSARWGQKIFRDFRGALRRAHLLVWTKGEVRPRDFRRPFVRVKMELPQAPSSSRYLLVTGLADGAHARQSIERAGYVIEKHLTFPDHARYAEVVVDSIVQEARSRGLKIAMTGKDWVKWRSFVPAPLNGSLIEVLEPKLQLDPSDEKIWNQVIWES
jgi:tetraacyldisaccharide 4'-kinase